MMTLQGNPHRSAAKGNGRGHREGMPGKRAPRVRRPDTNRMVTANPRLSNIFLHAGQGVEKSEETDGAGVGSGGRSLEEWPDWYFSFRARAERTKTGPTAGR